MNANNDIYLIGVGNYTEVIIELAQECGYNVIGLYHYNSSRNGEIVMDIPILSSFETLLATKDIKNINFAVTVGENLKRGEIASLIRKNGGKTPSLVHPLSKVAISSKFDTGCFIHAFSNLWTKASLGSDCIIGPYALISHHASIKDSCYVSSSSIVGSYTLVGKNTFVGLNSIILPALRIGENCFIGAKSNVTKSFVSNSKVKGNPAKQIKPSNEI